MAKTEHGIADIKKALEDKKIIIGTERTIKALKEGHVRTVYVTKNCPNQVKNDIAYYGKLAAADIIQLEQPNDELGALCRKPFSVSVVGIKG
ncbi:ribosomal L7Ae/L30e/S12e/Gadd45 family protein [Candidatus Woesearchaeota archaeon]|nr:ribosomal L7Ae/L30e/S12e/Gadd45 family protein [Candidatus Woesearchaeota archaeon]